MLEDVGTEWEVSPSELKTLRESGNPIVILDCREPEEIAVAALPGAVSIPMRQIPGRLEDLGTDTAIVVICHHGVRSLQVARWLKGNAGFEQVKSLRGGIDAWSREIDPSVARY